MSSAHDLPPQSARRPEHPLRTIREIRESLAAEQRAHFDAELAETDLDELPATLLRWATAAHDGFEQFVLSTPFACLDFGARSYNESSDGE